jgi:integrator complex subunit 7
VALAALACLVEIAAYSSKLKSDRGLQYKFFGHATQATEAEVGRNDDSVGIYHNATSFDYITRVGLLLCDHLAIVGSSIKGVSKDTKSLMLEKAHSLSTLVVQLSHECPQALPLMVESVVAIVKVVVHENFGGSQQGKPEGEETRAETREMDIDSEGGVKLSLKKNASMECQDSPVVISLTDHEDRSDLWLGFVLTLCKCIFVCVRGLELNVHRSAKVYPILRNLAVEVSMLDPPCEVLRGLLPAVLRTCSLQSQYACLEVRNLVETAVDKMMGIRDFWAVYRIATEAAVSGLWTVASHAFSILSSRVQSDGCYFWLEGLTKLAAAEASLTIDGSDVDSSGPQGMKAAKGVLTEVPISSEFSGSAETKSTQIKTDAEFGRRTEIGGDDDTQKCGMDSSGCGFKFSHGSYENDGCRFGEAASRAIPMFQSAAQSLAAGVCLERTFEFQRRVISLRLRLIQAVAELSKQVSLICANFQVVDSSYRIGKRAGPQKGRGMDRRGLYDMNIGILEPDVYGVNSRGNSSRIRRKGGEDQAGDCFVEEQYLRQENWRFRVFAVKAVSKAAQLKILTRELDLISISFPGIDKESFHLLCEWAVSCSLLAFCTSCVFSKTNAGCPDLEPRGAARDLNQRLKKCYGYESSQLSNFSAHLTEKLGSQELDSPIPGRFLNFCQWAIRSVFELLEESEAAGLKKVQERVGLLLKRIIGEWIRLPSYAPKFFFCTWYFSPIVFSPMLPDFFS